MIKLPLVTSNIFWARLLCSLLIPLLALNGKALATEIRSGQHSKVKTILVMGDSLSSAYGMERKKGWVKLLEQRLNNGEAKPDGTKHRYKVINASSSGETTGGGLARLPGLLDEYKPTVMILELGGNDGLRGYPIKNMKKNLSRMVILAREQGVSTLLVGMEIPPNYGKRYSRAFAATYPQLAKELNLPLVPFLLKDVVLTPGFMQADGIHPTAAAQEQILDNVYVQLQSLLD